MRTNLKVFRVRKKMTQNELADKAGVNRASYSLVEQGKRSGTMDFWGKIQKAFDIPENEMWSLMKNEVE